MPGLAGEVANLIVALKLDDSGFSGKLNAAARQLKGMDAGLSQVGKGVGQIGSGLGKLATVGAAAAVGGLTAVITTAASMEEAFTGVEKTVDASDAQFLELQDTLRKMSSLTGTSFEELARIGEIGGALGVGVKDLEGFIDVINRLAVSTDLTVESASTALGQLRTVLDLDDSELRGLADTLVALGNAGASTEPQIVDFAARIAIAGDRAGLSTDEILALSSAVTSMGIEVEAGSTAINKTFQDIAVAIGTGGDEVEAFTSLLGISAEEFERNWRENALGTFQEWLRELSKLDPIAQAVQLEMAGVTGSRQQAAVGALAKNWEFVGEQLEITKNDTGALTEESDKFFGTSAAGFRRLKENLRLTAATIGTELLPVTNELISEFINFLQEPETQAGIQDFAEGLAEGVRDFTKAVREIDWDPIISGLEFAGTVAKGVLDLFKSLPAPLQGLIVGGLALNKISGGAITDILKGVGNIAVGGPKALLGLRGATPANPVFVKDVGLPGTGGPGGAGGKGGGKFPLLGVAGAAGIALSLSGSDNPDAEMENKRIQLAKQLDQGIIDAAEAARLWAEAYGKTVDNPFVADSRADSGGRPSARGGSGTSEWARGLNDAVVTAVTSGTSEWAKGLNDLNNELTTLPDTAMLQSQTSRIVTELPPIRTAAQQQLMTQYAALSAVRETTGAVRGVQSTLASKDFNPTLMATVNVNVSSTMYQQTVQRTITARGVPTAPNEIR